MKRKSILVVTDNQLEIGMIEEGLGGSEAEISLTCVATGRNALDVLMGGVKTYTEGKLTLRPDAIVMSKNLRDMPAFELISILRKYYSLSHIRCFVMTDQMNAAEHAVYDRIVAGYLFTSSTDARTTADQFKAIRSSLKSSSLCNLVLCGATGGTTGVKLAWTTFKTSAALSKVAACAGAVVIGTVAYVAADHNDRDESPPPVISVTTAVHPGMIPEAPPEPATDTCVYIPEAVVLEEPVIEEEVIAAEAIADSTEQFAEAKPVPDSVLPKKTYSIGVRSFEGTK